MLRGNVLVRWKNAEVAACWVPNCTVSAPSLKAAGNTRSCTGFAMWHLVKIVHNLKVLKNGVKIVKITNLRANPDLAIQNFKTLIQDIRIIDILIQNIWYKEISEWNLIPEKIGNIAAKPRR